MSIIPILLAVACFVAGITIIHHATRLHRRLLQAIQDANHVSLESIRTWNPVVVFFTGFDKLIARSKRARFFKIAGGVLLIVLSFVLLVTACLG